MGFPAPVPGTQHPSPAPGPGSPPAKTQPDRKRNRTAGVLYAEARPGQVRGSARFPYVLFALGVVYLAGAMTRPAGWVTLLTSAVILTLSLIDAAFTISAAEAVTHGHAVTASVSFDLIDGPR